MGNSKIVYYGETLIDLTGDTVEAAKLLKGITAHDKKGEKITGTLSDVTQATPAITVDAAGKITASATQAAGVVAAGTKSATKQLPVQAAKTVTPSTSAKTVVASQRFTTGDVKVAAVNGIIRVTFPAGSTCTCKNGSTTLTSNASNGVAVFIVPNTGTWTLTATDGTKTATKTVRITSTSQSANVTLSYELIINFNKSVAASENTGYNMNTDYKALDAYTDLSNYNTLTFTVTARTWNNVGKGYIRFGINPSKAEAPTIYTEANAAGATTVTLDVSNVTGGYIGISCGANSAGVSGTSSTGATVSTIKAT